MHLATNTGKTNQDQLNRRECLRSSTGIAFAGAALISGTSRALGQAREQEEPKPVRIAVIGLGGRGRYLLKCLGRYHPGVEITALCELKPERMKLAAEMVKKISGNSPAEYGKSEYDYRNMLERDDVDGVLVATGVQKFAAISVDCMKASKDVGTEVTGPHSLEDCWAIVEEKERSGKHYMLLEQCVYGDVNLMILNMIKKGIFGEPYYATGSYVHDIKTGSPGKSRFVGADQSLSWRGRLMSEGHGSSYPAHGIGSPAKWMGINDGDRFDYCNAMMSDPLEIHHQLVGQFGANSPAAKIQFQTGDFLTTLIRTVKGKMIRLDYSLSNTRPYSRYYLLQGMNGCYDSRSGIYVTGDSRVQKYEWHKEAKFLAKYRHPYWTKDGTTALKTGGHAGMDHFCLRDFVSMIRDNREPWVDCYDAAAWNALNKCSEQSIAQRGAAVDIPDFTRGKWKDPNWRKDRVTPVSVLEG